MLGAAFFAAVLAVLAGHYYLVERPRHRRAGEARQPPPLTSRDVVDRQPPGLFLQPTFTWTRLRPDGQVEIGVHPLLMGLVGDKPILSLRAEGEQLERGTVLVSLGDGDRRLVVRSPLAGRVIRKNGRPESRAAWRGLHGGDSGWLYRVSPDRLADEMPAWMVGPPALEWSRKQYRRVRDHLLAAVSQVHGEVALADGGELPLGVLNQLDREAWAEFQETFLDA